MKFKIGFHSNHEEEKKRDKKYERVCAYEEDEVTFKPSLVEVYFPSRGRSYSYYNDRFDLHKGDTVFVEGKLEGLCGTVTCVNYNFRIKLSDYKRVISVADTDVRGTLQQTEKFFVSFEDDVIPFEKIASWYLPPSGVDDTIVSGKDDEFFLDLEDLESAPISSEIFRRGIEYYHMGKVVFLERDGGCCRAIVEGSRYYYVKFEYDEGAICGLTCDCFCTDVCKHEIAALLALRDLMQTIGKDLRENTELPDYFAALNKVEFCNRILLKQKHGSITLRKEEE